MITWLTLNLAALAIWVATHDAQHRGWDEFWPKWIFIVSTVVLVRRLTHHRRR